MIDLDFTCIDGIEITCFSEYDCKPIKNKLPAALKNRLFTANQWLERRCRVNDGVVGYDMHPNAMNKKLCTYYLDTQVEELTDEVCCATCSIRKGSFCVVSGGHISMTHLCSEWCN